jgi:hypothetical protein
MGLRSLICCGWLLHECSSDLAELVSAAANAAMERIQEMEGTHQQQMIVSRL